MVARFAFGAKHPAHSVLVDHRNRDDALGLIDLALDNRAGASIRPSASSAIAMINKNGMAGCFAPNANLATM